ncbi:hypothetical protein [Streptomyces hawaiiensis]|uniref:Uncharacterized protein n=1 Tax=Streptomyces hawaiiensis TaxID=67305 RepID=A0A6G5RMK0_9ACTN|nr:hypothetical protein [Streptomyces hawaiiensis]QCD59061.1 hypothetical protein CEB94_32660 [Streptomyces hawaiiensis]
MSNAAEQMHMRAHPLVQRFLSLELDPDHCAVFGSGPMLAHGLKMSLGDLDIVARGPAWQKACKDGALGVSTIGGDPVAAFWGGRVEVFNVWFPQDVSTDDLIDAADVVAGIRFVQLRHVLAYKRRLRRPKDVPDIAALEQALGAPAHAGSPQAA